MLSLRILLVTQNLKPENGWGTFSRGTAEELHQRGHTLLVLTHSLTADCAVVQRKGLPHPTAMVTSFFSRLKAAIALWKAIHSFRPDLIHFLVEPYAMTLPLVHTVQELPPSIMQLHGTYSIVPFEKSSTRSLLLKTYSFMNGFFVCSNYTKKRILNALDQYGGKEVARDIENKIRLCRLAVPFKGAMNEPHANAVKRILFVGAVKERKGILELIEGCIAFKKQTGTPFAVDIVGSFDSSKEYIQILRARIAEEELGEIVILHGHVSADALEKLYAGADAFAMLSRSSGSDFEGFGLVFLEANLRGIPTIGSSDSGCAEAIDEGMSGFVVDANNPAMVAERLQWILVENRIEPKNCRRWAEQHNVEQEVDAFEQLYKSHTE